jgi:hypothetical protein
MVPVVIPFTGSTTRHPSRPPTAAIHERLDQERGHHGRAGEPDRAEHGDFARALRHCRVHRVQRGQHRAEPHHERHQPPEHGDERRHRARLRLVVLALARDLHLQPRVAFELRLERLEIGHRGQPHRDRLEHAGRTLVRAVQDVGVCPDLGIERAAAGIKEADDFPCARPDAHARAEVEPFVGPSRMTADHDLLEARREETAFYDPHVVAHAERARRHPAHLHVRVGARLSHRQRRDHDDLGADERRAAALRDLRCVLHHAHRGHRERARHLRIGAALLDDCVLRQARRDDRRPEAAGERQHRDEHGHRAGDPEHRHERRRPAPAGTAQVVRDRDCHDQILRSASTTSSRMAPSAGSRPASSPVPSAKIVPATSAGGGR